MALSLGLGVSLGQAQAQTGVDEHKLKAAFLYNFLQFVEWPADALRSPDQSLQACVTANAPAALISALSALEGRRARGRAITVVQVRSIEQAKTCHLLYAEDSRDPITEAWLRSLVAAPVLTVSLGGAIAEGRVAIDLVQKEGRLRIALNLDTLRKARLKPSAKLIEVATTVYGNATGPAP